MKEESTVIPSSPKHNVYVRKGEEGMIQCPLFWVEAQFFVKFVFLLFLPLLVNAQGGVQNGLFQR
jgi:hypothetical protein